MRVNRCTDLLIAERLRSHAECFLHPAQKVLLDRWSYQAGWYFRFWRTIHRYWYISWC